nr:ATP synthase F0 subunit 6 [Bangiopsis subsimplex]
MLSVMEQFGLWSSSHAASVLVMLVINSGLHAGILTTMLVSMLLLMVSLVIPVFGPSRAHAGLALLGYVPGQLLSMSGLRAPSSFSSVLGMVFMVILMLNIAGMVPYVLAMTAHIWLTGLLSVIINAAIMARSMLRHGLAFFRSFLPVDVPLVIVPMLVIIELLSYGLKVATLAIRLFANITSGHILLVIIAGFVLSAMVIGSHWSLSMLASVSGSLLLMVLLVLEASVSVIQAVVFVLLSALYVADGDAAH